MTEIMFKTKYFFPKNQFFQCTLLSSHICISTNLSKESYILTSLHSERGTQRIYDPNTENKRDQQNTKTLLHGLSCKFNSGLIKQSSLLMVEILCYSNHHLPGSPRSKTKPGQMWRFSQHLP